MENRRLIVGGSGASGAPLAVETVRQLREMGVAVELIVTRGGEMTLREECGIGPQELAKCCEALYTQEEIGDGSASGSFAAMGMIVVPASMKTVAGIACGYSDNLLLRAADVALKERRRLVLLARECPFSAVHLRNMPELTKMGAVIVPPVMSFYNHPQCIGDMTRHIVCKALSLFDLEPKGYRRWEGMET